MVKERSSYDLCPLESSDSLFIPESGLFWSMFQKHLKKNKYICSVRGRSFLENVHCIQLVESVYILHDFGDDLLVLSIIGRKNVGIFKCNCGLSLFKGIFSCMSYFWCPLLLGVDPSFFLGFSFRLFCLTSWSAFSSSGLLLPNSLSFVC